MTLVVDVVPPGASWREAVAHARDEGLALSAYTVLDVALAESRAQPWLIVVRGMNARPVLVVGLTAFPGRALPGTIIYRAERITLPADLALLPELTRAIATAVRRLPRALRCVCEVVIDGALAQDVVAQAFETAGFSHAPVRQWRRTLVVPLAADPEVMLAGFSQKPRRDLRRLSELPVDVRPIADAGLVPRMQSLLEETYRARGGVPESAPWTRRMQLAADSPEVAYLRGLFRLDRSGDASLVAFAWGLRHGTHATYDVGASQRQPDLNVPLLTPLFWSLFRWAAANGATWFDLGGISSGTAQSGDPLGGISDFKRLFSKDEREISAAFALEPNPLTARLAALSSRVAKRFA